MPLLNPVQAATMVISTAMIPNCPADDTCANTETIRALLALDNTWSTVVKIATEPAPLAGAPAEERVERLNPLQTSSQMRPGACRRRSRSLVARSSR